MNSSATELEEQLKQSLVVKKGAASRTNPGLFRTCATPGFHHGTIDISPGWFARGHGVSDY